MHVEILIKKFPFSVAMLGVIDHEPFVLKKPRFKTTEHLYINVLNDFFFRFNIYRQIFEVKPMLTQENN